jgi:hypothetical protein
MMQKLRVSSMAMRAALSESGCARSIAMAMLFVRPSSFG